MKKLNSIAYLGDKLANHINHNATQFSYRIRRELLEWLATYPF